LRKILLAVFTSSILTAADCQQSYWQQQVNHTIDVSLNDKENSLDAFEKIEYINNSPDTLKFIWFHIWPNAHKSDRTAYSDQLLENGNTKFYFSNKEQKGYINRLDFKVNNVTAETEDHPQHIDIIKLLLPTPLAPGQQVIITTPFYVKLPFNFSRGGYDGETFQATQWYPKPAVYDRDGWHPMPYLDQGEFYSEFGDYDVSITVPDNYVVAATGELQNHEEKEWLKQRANYFWEPLKKKIKVKGTIKVVTQDYPSTSASIKKIRFKQNNVHDFAWFADKRFIVRQDTCLLSSGKQVEVFAYYTTKYSSEWQNSIQNAKAAIHHYSQLVGDYPYNAVSIVQGPESFGGGMEYPTITTISPGLKGRQLDNTIAHEIGHNWFYGILASNEREHPWMDEGINTFYENKYSETRHGNSLVSELIDFETTVVRKTDQPVNTPSVQFSKKNYYLGSYYKAATWLAYMESQLGTTVFNNAMREYYRRWQFKHPRPADLQKAMEESSGKDLDSSFALLQNKGLLPGQERKGTVVIHPLNPKAILTYLKRPTKNLLSVTPAFGANSYDKFMIGGLFHNLKYPPSRFQFLLAPMYATGSKKFAGLGLVNYTFYPKRAFAKIDIGLRGSTFSRDRYQDSTGKTFLSFHKIVPRVRLTLKQKDPRSTVFRYIQFKTFMITEDHLNFYNDSVFSGIDTIVSRKYKTPSEKRTLNQLLLVFENYRALYPYRAELKAEQGKGFVRLAFTGDYFFNYSSNKGGVDLRLFAGKFIYTNKNNADPYLYGLSLSAPKGNLDYTYSDYFLGRNDYPFRADGIKWTIPYQQIMIRDGGLKVNTDAQGNAGYSDDWIAAANFTFDIPDNINPLNLLPFNIPLKAFFDIGTYAQPWQKGATNDRFLFDAGLQVSLLKQLVNVYVPLVYSSVFKDYYKSILEKKGRFFKTISFSIDLSRFNSKRFIKNLPL
jgi:hypothetical protein